MRVGPVQAKQCFIVQLCGPVSAFAWDMPGVCLLSWGTILYALFSVSLVSWGADKTGHGSEAAILRKTFLRGWPWAGLWELDWCPVPYAEMNFP